MINLHIEDYCQKCNDFDVNVDCFTVGVIKESKEFNITCKHKYKCERMYKHLKECLEERNDIDE